MKVWRDRITYDYVNNDNEVVYSYAQTNAHTQPLVLPDEPSALPTTPPRAAAAPDTRGQESTSSSRSRVLIVVGSVGSFLSLAALAIYIRCGGGGKASRKSSRSRSRLSQASLSTHGSSGKPSAGDRSQHALSALLVKVNANAAQAQSESPEETSERGSYDDESEAADDIECNLVPRVFCDPGPGSIAAPPRNEQPLARIRREVLSPVVDAALGRAALSLSPTGAGAAPSVLSGRAGTHRATKSTPF